MDNIIKQAQRVRYVTTLLKRRRYLPNINSKTMRRQFCSTDGDEHSNQGSAADIIRLVMLKVEKSLRDNNLQARLLLPSP